MQQYLREFLFKFEICKNLRILNIFENHAITSIIEIIYYLDYYKRIILIAKKSTKFITICHLNCADNYSLNKIKIKTICNKMVKSTKKNEGNLLLIYLLKGGRFSFFFFT